jgi:acyl carrier protein
VTAGGELELERLAVALLGRCAEKLNVDDIGAVTLDAPVFGRGSLDLGSRRFDSIDLIEVIVAIEMDLGIRLLNRDDLVEAASLRGLAALVALRAEPTAIVRFCHQWTPRAGAIDPARS